MLIIFPRTYCIHKYLSASVIDPATVSRLGFTYWSNYIHLESSLLGTTSYPLDHKEDV